MRRLAVVLLLGVASLACTQSQAPSARPGHVVIPFEGAFDATTGRLTVTHGSPDGEQASAVTLPYGTGANQVYLHTDVPTVVWSAPTLSGDVSAVNGFGTALTSVTAIMDNIAPSGITWSGPHIYGTVPAMSASSAQTWVFTDPAAVSFTFNGHVDGQVGYGLVGHWPFEEGSGTSTADVSPLGNHGTLDGVSLPMWTTGKVGGGLLFSEVSYDSLVTVPDSPSLDLVEQVTISAWVRLDADITGDDLKVVALKTTDINWNDGYGLYHENGVGICGYVTLWDATRACAPFAAGPAVRHIAFTNDGTVMKIFVDGVLAGSNAFPVGISPTSQLLSIGSQYGIGYGWPGMIDEVRVYDRALSDAEILQLHDNP